MKKLTSLQILMLMSLSLGTSYAYSYSIHEANMDRAAQLELQSVQDDAATLDVLQDLAQSSPESIEEIIKNLEGLEAKFHSIKAFVDKRNKDIERFLEEQSGTEEQIAILAVELAEAQSVLEKTLALEQAKHKRNSKHRNKYEQAIKDALVKAEQGLKLLNKKTMRGFQQFKNSVNKSVTKMSSKKKSKTTKSAAKPSSDMNEAHEAVDFQAADAARHIPGVQNAVAQKLAEQNNISLEDANAIIDGAFMQGLRLTEDDDDASEN